MALRPNFSHLVASGLHPYHFHHHQWATIIDSNGPMGLPSKLRYVADLGLSNKAT